MMSGATTDNGERGRAWHASRGEVRRDDELHLALSCVVIRTSGARGRCHRCCMVTIESLCAVSHTHNRRDWLSSVGN
jgi:hypothetical protein